MLLTADEFNGTPFAEDEAEYLWDTATTSMKANWPSSSVHPGMSGRVLDDSSSDDYSAPPSDMEYGGGVCDDAAELRSSLLEFERMSPQHSPEFEYEASNQPAPPVLADISIFPRYATIPTRGYARFADVSNSGGKFNLRPLTDVTRGTHCSNVHQCDTIRDTAHEYDTLRGEKCHHKLLGAEERVVPSVEVNSRPSPLRNDDDGCRLVPQGRTHIDDSIKTLQSLEADRYYSTTLSGDINETVTLNDINEKLTLNRNNESLTPSGINEEVMLDGNNKSLPLSDINEKLTLTLSSINEKLTLDGNNKSLTLSDINENITLDGNNESLTLSGINEKLTLDGNNESLTLSDINEQLTFDGNNESQVPNDVNETLTLSGINDSLTLSGSKKSVMFRGINESLTLRDTKKSVMLSGIEPLTLNGDESTTISGLKFLTLCRNNTFVMLSSVSESTTLMVSCLQKSEVFSNTNESLTHNGNNESLLLSGFNDSLSLSGINETLREYFRGCLSSDQNKPILKRRSNMVDASVQTDPIEAASSDIESKRLDHIDVSRKRRIENECDEQVPTSAGLDDTCQLVATAVRVIAPDGFPRAASGDGEGIDLPSPVFKWNDGKRPRSETSAATQASLASNKRTRLRIGLSKRARPAPLHTTVPNGL